MGNGVRENSVKQQEEDSEENKNEGEWTGKVESGTKEEIAGSGPSMHGYILTDSKL